MAFIRPFVSFDFKRPERLGRANKIKVTKYFNFLEEIKNKYAAISPGRGNFERVQEDINPTFRRIPKKIKKTEFSKIFVPLDRAGSKIRKRGKRFVLESNGRRESIIPFTDGDYFASDTKGYIDSLVAGYPFGTLFRLYNPQDWKDQPFEAGIIGSEVAKFFGTFYREAAVSVEKGANGDERHAWGLLVEERIVEPVVEPGVEPGVETIKRRRRGVKKRKKT